MQTVRLDASLVTRLFPASGKPLPYIAFNRVSDQGYIAITKGNSNPAGMTAAGGENPALLLNGHAIPRGIVRSTKMIVKCVTIVSENPLAAAFSIPVSSFTDAFRGHGGSFQNQSIPLLSDCPQAKCA